MNLAAFGSTMLGLRAMRRLTQAELAAAVTAAGATATPVVTLSATTLGLIESGKVAPRIDVVWTICAVLRLDSDLVWALIMAELSPGDAVLPAPPPPPPPPPPVTYPAVTVASGGMTTNGNTYQLKAPAHGLTTGDRVTLAGVGLLAPGPYWVKVITVDFVTLWADPALTLAVTSAASTGGTMQRTP